jgi:hypothetical protein
MARYLVNTIVWVPNLATYANEDRRPPTDGHDLGPIRIGDPHIAAQFKYLIDASWEAWGR